MGKEKYTIILDTNVLGNYKKGTLKISDFKYFQTDKDVFGSLIRFISNNSLLEDVEIAISKISVEEIKWQQNKLFEEKKRKFTNLIKEFASIGKTIQKVAIHPSIFLSIRKRIHKVKTIYKVFIK